MPARPAATPAREPGKGALLSIGQVLAKLSPEFPDLTPSKLRFLEDPKKVFGDDEHVDTVANPSINSKAPEAAAFLKKFSWSGEEVGAVMLAIRDGAKPEDAAKDWISKNPERVAEWLK